MKRYWISWLQPTEDYRPLSYPANESVIGWWCTGFTENGTATLCALVKADSIEAAKGIVAIDWPDHGEFRFCDFRQNNFRPGDRFPLSDWMKPRIEALNA